MTSVPPSSDAPEDDVTDAVDEPWAASAAFVAMVRADAGAWRDVGDHTVASAVRERAGRVRVAGDAVVRAAVVDGAGAVDLWPGVARALELPSGLDLAAALRGAAGPMPAGTIPTVVVPLPTIPVAANRGRWAGVALLASVAAMAVLALGLRGAAPTPIDVARVDEVVVEDLVAAAGVEVWVDEANDGSMILWIDDREAKL